MNRSSWCWYTGRLLCMAAPGRRLLYVISEVLALKCGILGAVRHNPNSPCHPSKTAQSKRYRVPRWHWTSINRLCPMAGTQSPPPVVVARNKVFPGELAVELNVLSRSRPTYGIQDSSCSATTGRSMLAWFADLILVEPIALMLPSVLFIYVDFTISLDACFSTSHSEEC